MKAESTSTTAAARPDIKQARIRIADLKVDHLEHPLGLGNPVPRFSWRIESEERNVYQGAWRILVSASKDAAQAGIADVWDSGIVRSDRSFGIEYTGPALGSRKRCWWRVQVWDQSGTSSELSAVSWWEMGLLEPRDWIAEWITAEDSNARADRQMRLRWVWGKTGEDPSTHAFRFTLDLSEDAPHGELYVATNDWARWTQVTRVWLDGEPLGGTGAWGSGLELAVTEVQAPLSGWIRLSPVRRGRHVIAVEVKTAKVPEDLAHGALVRGLTLLARIRCTSGVTTRVGANAPCKTTVSPTGEWQSNTYDDTRWTSVRAVPLDEYQPWPPMPAMYLRRDFEVHAPVARARLYATALGAYEARINGLRVGDALLTPEPSRYDKRVLYRTYDVTPILRRGANTLGLTVADGWYASFDGCFAWDEAPRSILGQLEIDFADGTRVTVATGPGWRIAESPIRLARMRSGEVYDARLERPGWDAPGFDDSQWEDAATAPAPKCQVVAQTSPPIRATQVLTPASSIRKAPNVHVFEFPQNFSGWCRLHVKGAGGTRVDLFFSELPDADGEGVESRASLGELKRDVLILRGDARGETFEPRFVYRGFRHVEIRGSLPIEVLSIEGVVVHSDLRQTGLLLSSAPLIDRLWRNTLWTQRSNLIGIPTDCPNREQRGWLGDAGLFWDAASYNMDVSAFTTRFMDDVVDGQSRNGAFPVMAPAPRHNNAFFSIEASVPAWSDAGVILPWIVWQRFGDTHLIQKHWHAMNRHLQFIADHNPDFVRRNKRGWDFGDHVSLDRIGNQHALPGTANDLIGTAYWAHSADLLAQMAGELGRTADANRLYELRDKVRKAFCREFVKPDGTVGEGSQTAYILALRFNLLQQEQRETAAVKLVEEIRRRGTSLTTGILGTQFSLDVLTDAGFPDLAYDLLLRTAFPSWGYMIESGATTVWETWSGDFPVANKIAKVSHNHYALGAVCGFLFRRIAGIEPLAPGFKKICVRPSPDPRLKEGGGRYDSIMGPIQTRWAQLAPGHFTLDVAIPANSEAHIHLPARRDSRILENGRDIAKVYAVRIAERGESETIVATGSGKFSFVVRD